MSSPTDRKRPVATLLFALAVAMAVGLQVLLIVRIGSTPLRFAVADLVLPIAFGATMLASWQRGSSPVPDWEVPLLVPGLAVLTIWVAVAIVRGRMLEDAWLTWAVVNKGLGWLVLLGYFVVGGMLRTFAPPRTRRALLLGLVGFGAVAAMVSMVMLIAYKSGLPAYWGEIANYDRPRGFAENANAYGILTAVLLLLVLTEARFLRALPAEWSVAIGGLLVCSVLATGSRSGYLAALTGLIGLLWIGGLPWRRMAMTAGVGAALFAAVIGAADLGNALYSGRDGGGSDMYVFESPMIASGSTHERLTNMQTAWQHWRESPLLGIGLGRFMTLSRNADLDSPVQLHNTAMWILAEMGLIGLLLFAAFFLYVAIALFRRRGNGGPFDVAAMFVLLFAFAGASIGTEVLYQRYFWFLAGFLLAVPRHAARTET